MSKYVKYKPEIIGRLMEEAGIKSLAECARAIGLTPQGLNSYKARGRLPADRVLAFALEKGLDFTWIMKGTRIHGQRIAEVQPGYTVSNIPILADPIAAGPPREVGEKECEDIVQVPVKWGGRGGYAFRVKGTSMKPVFTEGDLVGISEFHGPVKALNGKIVAAWLEDEGLTVKRLRLLKGEAILLEPLNPEHDPIYIKVGEGKSLKLFRVDWWLGHQE